jgi:hypothetical protein
LLKNSCEEGEISLSGSGTRVRSIGTNTDNFSPAVQMAEETYALIRNYKDLVNLMVNKARLMEHHSHFLFNDPNSCGCLHSVAYQIHGLHVNSIVRGRGRAKKSRGRGRK